MVNLIIGTFAFLVLTGNPGVGSKAEPFDYFDVGLQMIENGRVERGLNIWLQAKTQLEEPDPKIGIAFIDEVTSNGLKKYYEYASYMYTWGLGTKDFSTYQRVLVDEINRLEPLVEPQTYDEWQRLLEEENPDVIRRIYSFWESIDPTLFTDYNERLLEHWERIAYAQEHFNRSRQEPYDTDDRGIIYVRFGPPDKTKMGRLEFNTSLAKGWTANMMQSAGNSVSNSVIDEFVDYTREFYTSPEYEFWIYEADSIINETKSLYLFGTDAGTGGFEQIETVEDFIPNRAFSMAPNRENLSVGGLRPGLILQMMYYNQLASAENYFARLLSRMETQSMAQGALSTSLGRQVRSLVRNEASELRHEKRQVSTYIQKMANIPIQVFQYRLLNKQNQPILATFFESRPQRAFWVDYLSQYGSRDDSTYTDSSYNNRGGILDHYRVLHGIKLYDSHQKLNNQELHDVDLVVGSNYASSTVLTLPHLPDEITQYFTVELYNYDPTTRYNIDTPFPPTLRGLGKKRVVQPEQMDINEGELAMGDIILGYDKHKPRDSLDIFPFEPANRNKIPSGNNLVIHMELYNLELAKDSTGANVTDFTMIYQMRPVSEFLSWTKKQEEDFTITLNFKTGGTQFREDLEIVTKELLPGRYRITLTIEQPHLGNGKVIHRSFPIELTDNW